jgi:hypothetical protein
VPPTLTKQSETIDRKATFSMVRPQGEWEWDKELRRSIIGSRVDLTSNSGSVNSKPMTRVVVSNKNSYQEDSEEEEEYQNAIEEKGMKKFFNDNSLYLQAFHKLYCCKVKVPAEKKPRTVPLADTKSRKLSN